MTNFIRLLMDTAAGDRPTANVVTYNRTTIRPISITSDSGQIWLMSEIPSGRNRYLQQVCVLAPRSQPVIAKTRHDHAIPFLWRGDEVTGHWILPVTHVPTMADLVVITADPCILEVLFIEEMLDTAQPAMTWLGQMTVDGDIVSETRPAPWIIEPYADRAADPGLVDEQMAWK